MGLVPHEARMGCRLVETMEWIRAIRHHLAILVGRLCTVVGRRRLLAQRRTGKADGSEWDGMYNKHDGWRWRLARHASGRLGASKANRCICS